ncbi:MAG: bacillithiol biosynthesis deacetylase BshB1 [Cytophagaceae bacterium]|nr:bacillithiol biosynthesis deacetylase BshB1 [Cytophagaceae bacterium]
MKLDILVISSHPDDAELGCGGTIITHIKKGRKVGIADLTRGELGTRGTPEIRDEEAKAASKILGLSVRENLGFADGFFQNDKEHNIELIKVIRKYQPEIVLANAIYDRHTDHGMGAELAYKACFLSGLAKIETKVNGAFQPAWRPKHLYNFIQDKYIQPDFILDISDAWEKKIEAIKAFKSQFYNPESVAPATYISSPEFLEYIKARAMEMGHAIGVKYGEGFTKNRLVGVKDLFDLI